MTIHEAAIFIIPTKSDPNLIGGFNSLLSFSWLPTSICGPYVRFSCILNSAHALNKQKITLNKCWFLGKMKRVPISYTISE